MADGPIGGQDHVHQQRGPHMATSLDRSSTESYSVPTVNEGMG